MQARFGEGRLETDWPRNYQKYILASRKHSTAPRWPPTLLYTVANRLYHDYDAFGIGNYVPHGGGITRKMRRAMNNQSLNRRFKLVLAWVALRSGKQYLEWEEGGSTRTCHDCGFVVEDGIPPEIREWDCPGENCSSHHIRDENAARNGLNRTLKALGLPCSDRREVSSRRAWRFNGLGLTSGVR